MRTVLRPRRDNVYQDMARHAIRRGGPTPTRGRCLKTDSTGIMYVFYTVLPGGVREKEAEEPIREL